MTDARARPVHGGAAPVEPDGAGATGPGRTMAEVRAEFDRLHGAPKG